MTKKWKIIIAIFVGLVLIGAVTSEDDPKESEEVISEEVKAEEPKKGDEPDKQEEDKSVTEDEINKENEKVKAKELAAEEEYESGIGELSGNMAEYMSKFSDANMEMSENPMILYDNEWVYKVAGIIAGMSVTLDKMNELEAPEKYKEMDKYLKEATKEYKFVTDNYPKAIDNMDVDMLMKCVDKLNAGNDLIDKANEERLKLNN